MIDKKEKKRDIASFCAGLKQLMNIPTSNNVGTLIRDGTFFLYGRILSLIKHNDNKAICSIGDLGFAIGVVTSNLLDELVKDLTPEQKSAIMESVQQNFIDGLYASTKKEEISDKQETNPDTIN